MALANYLRASAAHSKNLVGRSRVAISSWTPMLPTQQQYPRLAVTGLRSRIYHVPAVSAYTTQTISHQEMEKHVAGIVQAAENLNDDEPTADLKKTSDESSNATADGSKPPAEDKMKKKKKKKEDKEVVENKLERTVRNLIMKKMEDQQKLSKSFDQADSDSDKQIPLSQRALAIVKSGGSLVVRMGTPKFWVDLWATIKHEAQHYKAGFQLLWADIRISTRLLGKILRGNVLTRREKTQFIRTVGDLFRLVPFSVFIIIPGLELLLPFALKMFPNMLPSQFAETKSKEDKIRAQLRVKLEMAKFLQETVQEMAVTAGKSKKDESSSLVQEFAEFLQKGREGRRVSTSDILKYASLFRNELTLDKLNRGQLLALTRLLLLNPVGTDAILQFQLRMKLRQLKADDELIAEEGVDSLSVPELQQACRDRGMRAIGISVDSLRFQLKQWLELHLKEGVPATLLLLSRIMFLSENVHPHEQLMFAIENLPDDVLESVSIDLQETSGSDVDPLTRLKIISKEEQKIREERAAEKKRKALEDQQAKVKQAALEVEQAKQAAEEELESPVPLTPTSKDSSEIRMDAEEFRDIAAAIEELAQSDSGSEGLRELKEEMTEFKADIRLLKDETDGKIAPSVGTIRLANRVESLVKQVEGSLAQIGTSNKAPAVEIVDGTIASEDLISVLETIPNHPSNEKIEKMAEVFSNDEGRVSLTSADEVMDLVQQSGEDITMKDLEVLIGVVKERPSDEADKIKLIHVDANTTDEFINLVEEVRGSEDNADEVKVLLVHPAGEGLIQCTQDDEDTIAKTPSTADSKDSTQK